MPSPSSSLATLRPDLAASFEEFNLEMDRQGFIGYQVLPVSDVEKASGNFGIIPIEQLLQTRDTARAPGSGYSRGKFRFDDASYATAEHGAEEPVDDNEAAMYAAYFRAEQVASQRAFDAVLRNAEIRVAAKVFDTAVFTGDLTTAVGTEWSNAASATPIDDVLAAKLAIYGRTGIWPNALTITRRVFLNLRETAQIRDRVASSGAGGSTLAKNVTIQQIAEAFDLDRIIVANTAKNTANEGQTASLSDIWDDEYAMVCRVASGDDFREACIGRTFHWAEDGSQIGGTVETYREEQTRSDIVRVRHQVQEKILYPEMGQLLSNITA